MVDYSGKIAVPLAILLNIGRWVGQLQINQWLTIGVSLFSLIYLFIKIYDGWLGIKIKKEDLKKAVAENNEDVA